MAYRIDKALQGNCIQRVTLQTMSHNFTGTGKNIQTAA